MTQPLIILGTGGSAYDVLDVVEAINAVSPAWDVVGFLDDARSPGERHLGHREVEAPHRPRSGSSGCSTSHVASVTCSWLGSSPSTRRSSMSRTCDHRGCSG